MAEILSKNLSPYKEIGFGDKSIYDFVDPNFIVDDQVITYLKVGMCKAVTLGTFKHPFEPGKSVSGPYWFFDDSNNCWESHLAEYVVKYKVTLPKEFIDHALSINGCKFILKNIDHCGCWSAGVREWRKKKLLKKIKALENSELIYRG